MEDTTTILLFTVFISHAVVLRVGFCLSKTVRFLRILFHFLFNSANIPPFACIICLVNAHGNSSGVGKGYLTARQVHSLSHVRLHRYTQAVLFNGKALPSYLLTKGDAQGVTFVALSATARAVGIRTCIIFGMCPLRVPSLDITRLIILINWFVNTQDVLLANEGDCL